MSKLKMAVIGVGHLGQAHARILAALPEVDLVGVADANGEQAQTVAARHGTRAYADFAPLVEAADAACIVVPTSHHAKVAAAFLERGKAVLIEKPLAPTLAEADAIVALAERHSAVVQVGHIERFNPAFEALAARKLRPKYVVSERHGPFTGRSMDIGVVLDLMVHDLDLIAALDGTPAVSVEAIGLSVLGSGEDVANARIRFASGCVADLTVCRVAPIPKRRMQVWSPEAVATIDFASRRLTVVTPSEALRRGLSFGAMEVGLREALKNDLFGKHLRIDETVCEARHDQLTCEIKHFIQCVTTGQQPRVCGRAGRDAVALACRVVESLRLHCWDGLKRAA